MTTRFISLATAIVTLDVYLRSQLYSNDPLFLFTSNNIVVNVGLVILAASAVAVSFRSRFKSWLSYAVCAGLAIVLGIIGVIGSFFSNIFYSFPAVLLPLDYLFIMEAAVIFGICALTYRHEAYPYKWQPPNLSAIYRKSVFPVPRIPHSPTGLSRTSVSKTNLKLVRSNLRTSLRQAPRLILRPRGPQHSRSGRVIHA